MSIDSSCFLHLTMSPVKRRGRPPLSASERSARNKACKKQWADRHRQYVRAQIAALNARPEYKARRRELHRLRKLAWLEAGGVPGHRGSPRIDPVVDFVA